MRKEQIISKGIYTGAQYPELVSVKQYIIFRQNEGKCLLLRFSNDRNESVNSIRFRLKQLDVKGNVIYNDAYSFDGIKASAGKTFALDKEISISESCVDFVVEMESAQYGEYEYTLNNGELVATYNKKSDEPPFDKEKIRRKFNGENQNIIGKTLKAPKMIFFSMLAALLIIAAFSYAQLRYFMSTEETFTLENVEYAFTTEDRESGPISIISYNGKAGHVIVPSEIEGHKVESIAEGAFKRMRLVSVSIEGDLAIGDSAFAECKYLESVEMPNVAYLGRGIFEGCSALKSVKTEKVTYIGTKAFKGCKKLEDIVLPTTLTEVGDYAFSGCESIKELTIPDSVTKIGTEILANCNSIKSLKVPFIGSNITKPVGLKFFYGNDNVAKSVKSLESITVTKMTVITDEAFKDCISVKSVSLPDNVTKIGESAFKNCVSLKEFKIPSSVNKIGASAFEGCASLKEISIPSGVVEIPRKAFSGCKSLVSISLPSSILHIRENAFGDCSSISSVILPVNLQTLERGAFAYCTGIKDMTLSFIGVNVNQPYTLAELFLTTEVEIENVRVRGAKALAEYTFTGFTKLVSVNIGGAIESIEQYCFADSGNLKNVVLPDSITDIGEGAFANCVALESVNMPENITVINSKTFMNCKSLEEIYISKNVTSVGESAFAGCKSLTGLDWISSITEIGESAFAGCEQLESVTVNSAITELPNALFKNCVALSDVVLPSELTSIGDEAFNGCSSLAAIIIPEQVTYIGDSAFALCEGLTEITIPSSVTEIGSKAFQECNGIAKLVIPTTVEALGSDIVEDCASLVEITLPFLGSSRDENFSIRYIVGDDVPVSLEKVIIIEEDTIVEKAFYECENIKEIILCDEIKDIGSYAFFRCGISGIELPSTIEKIGEYAFAGTPLLAIDIPESVTVIESGILDQCLIEEISIPFIGNDSSRVSSVKNLFDGYSVPDSLKKITITGATSIDSFAFYDCDYIEEITITSDATGIGTSAFADCFSLVSVTIPDTVTSIGDYCFQSDEKLASIIIPDSVQIMGYHMLEGCNSITEISIPFVGLQKNDANNFSAIFGGNNWSLPENLTSVTVTNETRVKNYAFYECRLLEEITYEIGLESIGVYAFASCYKLKEIDLSYNLESIGEYGFAWCYNLSSIAIPISTTYIGIGAFDGCTNLLEVYNFSNVNSYSISQSSLRNHCVAYRSDNTVVKKLEVNDLEFILGDDGSWYFNRYLSDGINIVFPSSLIFENEEITSYIIPSYSFYQDKNISCVTVTNAAEIYYSAFLQCENLKEIYNLSDKDIQRGSYEYGNIGYYAYIIHKSAEEEALQEVKVGDTIFLKSGSNWFLKKYEGTDKKLVLDEFEYEGETVSSYEILEYAFQYNYEIEEIVIGNAVKKIGRYAFYNIGSVKKVSFENNTSITTIPEWCFAYCYSLSQLVLPSSLTVIDHEAFYDCYMLLDIYNLSEMELTIGSYDNGGVAKYAIVIHKSMDEEPLKEVSIGDFIYLKSDDLWILKSYTGDKTTLELKDFEYDGKKITSYSIGANAFQFNSYLKEITIGNEVKSIGVYSFADCHQLEKLSFEDNTQITDIPQYAFAWCSNLKTVILPSSLEIIENYGFGGCNNLVEIFNPSEMELTIGDRNNGEIAKNALIIHTSIDATPLESVTVDGFEFLTNKNDVWGLVKYSGTEETIDFKNLKYDDKDINNIVILPYAFQNTTVKKVLLGNEVAEIRENSFSFSMIEYVSFKDCSNITVIPEQAFAYCYELHTVVLSQYITDIYWNAFVQCTSMYNVCNLSNLYIYYGSTNYGYIAYYAKNICNSEEDIVEIHNIKEQNYTFRFRKVGDTWEMYSTNITSDYVDTLPLPELVIDDEVQDYDIVTNLPSCNYLIIPESVKSIQNSWQMRIDSVLYFGEGNALDLFNKSNYTYKYCYVDCVHNEEEWTYDEFGGIVTTYDVNISITDPTCAKEGSRDYECNRCDEEWSEAIPTIDHSVDPETKKCISCGIQFTAYSISDYWEIENDSKYPFETDTIEKIKTYKITETATAMLTLVAKSDFFVYFDATLVKENTGTVYGVIKHSREESILLSSMIWSTDNVYAFNLKVNEGDVITINYIHNSTGDNNDSMMINNIMYSDR